MLCSVVDCGKVAYGCVRNVESGVERVMCRKHFRVSVRTGKFECVEVF